MKLFAWAWLVLGLLMAVPVSVRAQDASASANVGLGRNYPNPFNPETFIPFSIPSTAFAGGHRPVVSIRIYNVLAQLVAIPILQGSGEVLDNVPIDWNGSGTYTAYWDGKLRGTDRETPSGVYVYQLIVDGRPQKSLKMTVAK